MDGRRFRLAPQLTKVLSVPTPAVRKPGSVWTELPRPVSAGAEPVGHVRRGYARASTARQSLDAQLDTLAPRIARKGTDSYAEMLEALALRRRGPSLCGCAYREGRPTTWRRRASTSYRFKRLIRA
jgi:hypothetical protein